MNILFEWKLPSMTKHIYNILDWSTLKLEINENSLGVQSIVMVWLMEVVWLMGECSMIP
jgi:hypothetical protein